jgi:hypothetical protein
MGSERFQSIVSVLFDAELLAKQPSAKIITCASLAPYSTDRTTCSRRQNSGVARAPEVGGGQIWYLPLGSRAKPVVGGLGDKVPQKLKHFCMFKQKILIIILKAMSTFQR